jgi:hypothetical protein
MERFRLLKREAPRFDDIINLPPSQFFPLPKMKRLFKSNGATYGKALFSMVLPYFSPAARLRFRSMNCLARFCELQRDLIQ